MGKYSIFTKNNTKHTNTESGQNSQILNVTAGGTYIYHLVLKA